jgi:hypothetical protein
MEMVDLSYAFIRSSFVRHFRLLSTVPVVFSEANYLRLTASTSLSSTILGFMGGLLGSSSWFIEVTFKPSTNREQQREEC